MARKFGPLFCALLQERRIQELTDSEYRVYTTMLGMKEGNAAGIFSCHKSEIRRLCGNKHPDTVNKALRSLEQKELIYYDHQLEVVAIRDYIDMSLKYLGKILPSIRDAIAEASSHYSDCCFYPSWTSRISEILPVKPPRFQESENSLPQYAGAKASARQTETETETERKNAHSAQQHFPKSRAKGAKVIDLADEARQQKARISAEGSNGAPKRTQSSSPIPHENTAVSR